MKIKCLITTDFTGWNYLANLSACPGDPLCTLRTCACGSAINDKRSLLSQVRIPQSRGAPGGSAAAQPGRVPSARTERSSCGWGWKALPLGCAPAVDNCGITAGGFSRSGIPAARCSWSGAGAAAAPGAQRAAPGAPLEGCAGSRNRREAGETTRWHYDPADEQLKHYLYCRLKNMPE